MIDEIQAMVLDDEPIVCERLQDYLEKKGISVEVFTDSREALKRLEQKDFDVIITDVKMAGPSGIDVLAAVKKKSYDAEVIIITGYGSFETLREAEALGAYDFVFKPFKMLDLYNTVKKAAKRSRKRSKSK